MKKEFKGVLIAIALFAIVGAGRNNVFVQRVYQNEGDLPIPYSTVLSSTTWTVIGSGALRKRRALGIQNPTENAGTVCVSTTSASGDACNIDTPGYKVEAGASLTINDEAAWYAKSYAGSTSTIVGAEHTDSQDTED